MKVVETEGGKQKIGPSSKVKNEDSQEDCKARQARTTITLRLRKKCSIDQMEVQTLSLCAVVERSRILQV